MMISAKPVSAPHDGVAVSHLGALDGLRGLMALWVVLGHACTLTGMSYIPVMRSAHYAVDGFMLLSGFLMTYHYTLRAKKEPWSRPATWLVFYVRRFFRISPLYYASLIPAYALYSQFHYWAVAIHAKTGGAEVAPSPPLDLTHVLLHVTYLFGMIPRYHASLILPDWSLSLEMQYYAVFPFLMLVVLRFGWVSLSVLSAAVWLWSTSHFGFSHQFMQPSPLPLSILWFVIGMVWANAYINYQGKQRVLAVLGACVLALVSRDAHDIALIAVFAWVLFSEGSYALGPAAPRVRALLSGRVAKFMGDASYSVYLTHLLILTPLCYFLIQNTGLGATGRFLVACSVAVALAYGIAKPLEIIEQYGITIGRQLARRISAPPRPNEAGPNQAAPNQAAPNQG